MSQRVFDAFVFDLDGTLVDTASELIAAYQKLCIELGGGEKPFDDARKLISHGSGRLVTEATGIEEGDPRWEPYRQQYLDWYEELLGSTAQPYDGLVEVLKAAHSAGKKWGVVTNKFRRFAEPLMNEMPFEPSAGVLVTPCDVTHAKPIQNQFCSQRRVKRVTRGNGLRRRSYSGYRVRQCCGVLHRRGEIRLHRRSR